MFSFTIFILSGVAIVVIVSAKWWELRKHESVWVLRMISKGDESFKILSHNATHLYSVYREKLEFLIKKQVPLHSKNIVNKTSSLVKQKLVEIKGDIRNTK